MQYKFLQKFYYLKITRISINKNLFNNLIVHYPKGQKETIAFLLIGPNILESFKTLKLSFNKKILFFQNKALNHFICIRKIIQLIIAN